MSLMWSSLARRDALMQSAMVSPIRRVVARPLASARARAELGTSYALVMHRTGSCSVRSNAPTRKCQFPVIQLECG